jgi:hypothetical protein
MMICSKYQCPQRRGEEKKYSPDSNKNKSVILILVLSWLVSALEGCANKLWFCRYGKGGHLPISTDYEQQTKGSLLSFLLTINIYGRANSQTDQDVA